MKAHSMVHLTSAMPGYLRRKSFIWIRAPPFISNKSAAYLSHVWISMQEIFT